MTKIISFSRDGKGRVVKRNLRDIANTLHGSSSSGSTTTQYILETTDTMEENEPHYRIRKLTPKECLRLMDVDDSNIEKMRSATLPNGKPVSNSQLYKMAGNSIVVSCLFHIFRNLFITPSKKPAKPVQLSLFDL